MQIAQFAPTIAARLAGRPAAGETVGIMRSLNQDNVTSMMRGGDSVFISSHRRILPD
jgi:hypothetical protein